MDPGWVGIGITKTGSQVNHYFNDLCCVHVSSSRWWFFSTRVPIQLNTLEFRGFTEKFLVVNKKSSH